MPQQQREAVDAQRDAPAKLGLAAMLKFLKKNTDEQTTAGKENRASTNNCKLAIGAFVVCARIPNTESLCKKEKFRYQRSSTKLATLLMLLRRGVNQLCCFCASSFCHRLSDPWNS